jgi:membrane protease YdiL (CAAX protease family)
MQENTTEPGIKRGWLRALVILLPFVIFSGVFTFIGALIMGITTGQNPMDIQHGMDTLNPLGILIVQGFATIGTLMTVWIFTAQVDNKKIKEIGLSFSSQTKNTIWGVALGFILMGVGTLILILSDNLSIESINSNNINLIYSFFIFVLVSVNEEVLVRGYMLRNLMDSMNRYLALVVSSLLFVALHLFNPNLSSIGLLNLFLAGILLGISYIFTKNLWFPIALHFSWNFFQGPIFGYEVSGNTFYTLIKQKLQGNEILTGGKFGFEGSILASILCTIAIIACWYIYKKQDVIPSKINT